MEVLRFEYDATGPSIRASVPAMRDDGVVLLGVTNPETTLTIAELLAESPEIGVRLVALLADLEPFVRARATRPIADPSAIQAAANDNAREKERVRVARLDAEKATLEAERARADHDEAVRKSRSMLAELKAEHDATAAALAELAARHAAKQRELEEPRPEPDTKEE